MKFSIYKQNKSIEGIVDLDGSKSISNRALVIRALCAKDFEIGRLSTSDDTRVLLRGLEATTETVDIGAAGTSMRFLTALLATQVGKSTILTGSERMKERPIGVLVDALRTLGADIAYVEKDGFPPLRIKGKRLEGGSISIKSGISSQYISALLMLGPTFEKGLDLTLEGDMVSRTYIEMTLALMAYFGIEHVWDGQTIRILPQAYQAKDFVVEADWSAASYHYSLMALANSGSLQLNGLFEKSVQGDRVLVEIMQPLGVQTTFQETGVLLTKTAVTTEFFEQDFVLCPDLAQTLAVVCTGLGIPGRFLGLQTLAIKETDRTLALEQELHQFGAAFSGAHDVWILSVHAKVFEDVPVIKTYHDHRMAMAFAPLALKLKGHLVIEDPMVVTKSYPLFWEDLRGLGFLVEEKNGV